MEKLLTLQAKGACKGHDPYLWFPDRNRVSAKARDICAGCPVRQLCLEYAIEEDEQFGVWGGLTPTQRKGLRNDNSD